MTEAQTKREAANPYRDVARARKAARILAIVPAGDDREEIDATADWLAELPQADRNALAAKAGTTAPSETTWRMVVDGQRARQSWSEVRDAAGCAPVIDEGCTGRRWCRCDRCMDTATERSGR